MQAVYTIQSAQIDAVIFDLDGVVTQTALLHRAAWKTMFDTFLAALPTGPDTAPQLPFGEDDYRLYVDGKPRHDGARSFLAARGLWLPEGEPHDPPEQDTVFGLGRRKDRLFAELLDQQGVKSYPAAVALLHALREAGVQIAVVTSSKHCDEVLAAAGLQGLFAAQVDGKELERCGLAGKPAPDAFVEAARRLGVPPKRAVVVEDAVSGVQAGAAGGFAAVIGVDRTGHPENLRSAGATVVVDTLAEVALSP